MLILTRKINEGIVIGEDIKIKIVGIEGNRVKIGVEAPKRVNIVREEIVEAVKRENQLAGSIDFTVFDFDILKPGK